MTIEELSKYYYIKKEIEKITTRLEILQSTIVGSINISDTPKSSFISNPTEEVVLKKIKLENLLNKKLADLLDQELIIENFISSIEDVTIKIIVRMRFLDLCNWKDIAKELNYDRSNPRKKLEKYLEMINKGKVDIL